MSVCRSVMTTLLVCMVLSYACVSLAAPGGDEMTLTGIRAARAAAMRLAVAAKAGQDDPARFGLLVIPVDFADERFGENWDAGAELGPRLFPLNDETLANYYQVASRGRAELRIMLAPLVHLPGDRADYSDIGLNGYTRTREMATLAAQGVADLGFDFRLLDIDGPDRVPGSGDDDGQVDGVLVLHSGVGTENDTVDGRIVALQYFLDEPVVSNGTAIVSYAVASQRSGLGIWAHETGHLLGLEERYDPFLPTAAGDVMSRGGLGRFSVMSAGAWGTGNGNQPALLDAYSAARLGWCSVVQMRGDTAAGSRIDTVGTAHATGQVHRIWTRGAAGSEYFLIETRGDPDALPFDHGIPSGQLLIYHVDESVSEGSGSGGSDYHLRVRLVEADGDQALFSGEDFGTSTDLFPGDLNLADWTATSVPPSGGYSGPSEVELTQITSLDNGVSLVVSDASSAAHEFEFSFTGQSPAPLVLVARETGLPFLSAAVTVEIVDGQQWGEFTGSGNSVDITLTRQADGGWVPGTDVSWTAASDVAVGAETTFAFTFRGTTAAGDWTAASVNRTWVWEAQNDVLDFAQNWHGGGWEIVTADTRYETTWHFWADTPFITADESPVLICSGDEFTSSDMWGSARYYPGADAALLSPYLTEPFAGVLMVHAIDCEMLRSGIAIDGGVAEWVMPDGRRQTAAVIGGYRSIIDARSGSALHDSPVFAGNDSLTAARVFNWRADFILAPEGPGPFRLCLHFAANNRAIGKGWMVSRLMEIDSIPPEGLFPLSLDEDPATGGLCLNWSLHAVDADSFAVEHLAVGQDVWQEIWRGVPDSGTTPADHVLSFTELDLTPPESPQARNEFRVVALAEYGRVNSRPQIYHQDEGPAPLVLWGQAYPNPANSSVRLLLELPDGNISGLSLFDIRGRRVRNWSLDGGTRLLTWEGTDQHGSPLPAGVYYFRLTAAGRTEVQKVVWLR